MTLSDDAYTKISLISMKDVEETYEDRGRFRGNGRVLFRVGIEVQDRSVLRDQQ